MKGVKKCFGLLLVLSIIFLSLLNVYSVSAITKDYNALSFMYNTPYDQTYVSTGLLSYDSPKFNIHSINELATRISSVSVPSNSNYLSYTSKFNLLTWTDNGSTSYLPADYGDLVLYSVKINNSTYPFESANVQRFVTDFTCDPLDAGVRTNCRTITYQVSFVVKNIPSSISNIVVGIEYDSGSLFTGYRDGFNAYFEPASNNYVSVDFSYDYTSALLQQQIQQNEITINSINNINEAIDLQNERDSQDRQDLQDASDDAAADASSSQSQAQSTGTTLLSAFSAFVTALTSASPTNCNIDMDLGNLDLGVVNFCQLSLPQPIPTVASIFMILFFVPLSIATARKVINLFRSFQ